MGAIECSVAIEAPPAAVFRRLIDIANLCEWVTQVVGHDGLGPRSIRRGDRFTLMARFVGHDLDSTWNVVELRRPRLVTYRATGPAGSTATMTQTVRAERGHSRVDVDVNYTLPGGSLGALADYLMLENQIVSEADRILEKLKTLIEQSA